MGTQQMSLGVIGDRYFRIRCEMHINTRILTLNSLTKGIHPNATID